MDSLPNEIIMKILKYVSTLDLFNFCEVFEELDYFMREKTLVRKSNWSKLFELNRMNICNTIPARVDTSLIKVLNVNYLYWIPCQELRELVSELRNLEELQAMDTKIGLCEDDIRLYLRLKKLAISVFPSTFEPPDTWTTMKNQKLFNIRSMCMKVYLENTFERELLLAFITNSLRLEELWVQDFVSSDHETNYDVLVIRMLSLRRVVMSFVQAILPAYEFNLWGFTTVFSTQRCHSASELIFEKLSEPFDENEVKPPVTVLEKAWKRFRDLQSFPACGVKEYKVLHMAEIDKVYFEEMDFCHSHSTCSYYFCKSAMEVLNSPNSRKMRKLQIKSCLWIPKKPKQRVIPPVVPPENEGEAAAAEAAAAEAAPEAAAAAPAAAPVAEEEEEVVEDYDDDDDSVEEEEEYSVELKRARCEVPPEPVELHPFYDVARNLSRLEELEIFVCPSRRCHKPRLVHAFRFIEMFKILRRLLLKIHLITDGSFFKEMFTKCELLESVSVKCTINDEEFMMDLLQNIKISTSLRDFKLEYGEMDIDEIFAKLDEITNKKLLRLVLKCDVLYFSTSSSLTEPFAKFLEKNPQLVVFYVVAYKASNDEMNDIHEIMNNYAEEWRILYAGTEDKFSVQYAHYDIIDNPNRVASVDFDRF